MPHALHRGGYPGIAATAINAGAAVAQDTATDRAFVPIASRNIRPFGIAQASAPNAGDGVAIFDEGNTEVLIAGASLGRGAEIGVASTNGALAPVAAASGSVVYSVGQSVSAAAAGEEFSLYVNPRQLSGLA